MTKSVVAALPKSAARIGHSRGRRPYVARIACGTLLIAGVVAGALAYRHHQQFKYLAVHDPGRVIRSSWLEPGPLAEVLKKHHVRTVVNLCMPDEKIERVAEERAAVEQNGARLVEFVFPSNFTSTTDDAVFREFERLVDDPNAYPIYVHCWHGIERTAKALAIYDIRRRGFNAEEAVSAARWPGRALPKPIVDFIYNYAALHAGEAASKTAAHDAAVTGPELRPTPR